MILFNCTFQFYVQISQLFIALLSRCFFTTPENVHNYNTRAAANQTYYLPRPRTNYGLFNICFHGLKMWNSLAKYVKSPSLKGFKDNLKKELLGKY